MSWMVVRPGYRTPLAKKDGSQVTPADIALQIVVVRHLRERLGLVRIIAEETLASLSGDSTAWHHVEVAMEEFAAWWGWPLANREELERLLLLGSEFHAGPYWSIDPIDGTSGWVDGRACCTCIAHVQDGQADLGGIVMAPAPPDWINAVPAVREGIALVAGRGRGCWALRFDESGALLDGTRVARGSSHRPPVWLCSVRGGPRTDRAQRILHRAGCAGATLPIDSQCKYGLVALGVGDVAMRAARPGTAPEQAWDHAAGMLLAAEAGAAATDMQGATVAFDEAGLLSLNMGTLACGADIHPAILGAAQIEYKAGT